MTYWIYRKNARKLHFKVQKLAYIEKLLYFCVAKRKTNTIMVTTQPTFNQVFDLACMLPYSEQQQLIDHVQGNLFEHLHRVEETPDELKARLREAHRQAIAGEIYSQEEAHDLMREYVKQRLLHSA